MSLGFLHDCTAGYGPHKTLYNRLVRWSRLGVFDRIFAALAPAAGVLGQLMIDSTNLKAHRTAASLAKKGRAPHCLGRTKVRLNAKLHAVCDGQGRPVAMLLTEGQTSHHVGAALLLPVLPAARELIADRGYHSTRFRQARSKRWEAIC
jgi:transposase